MTDLKTMLLAEIIRTAIAILELFAGKLSLSHHDKDRAKDLQELLQMKVDELKRIDFV